MHVTGQLPASFPKDIRLAPTGALASWNDGGVRWWPNRPFKSWKKTLMKRITLQLLGLCLALGALAPLAAQDLTITNARIVVGNGTVIERGSIVVRAGKIVSAAAGAPSATSGQTIDARGHERDAGLHRCAQAHQYRPRREGADAAAARGGLHDGSVRRRSRRRQPHAARSHRAGPHQRPADHPVGTYPAWLSTRRSRRARKSARWPRRASSTRARSR